MKTSLNTLFLGLVLLGATSARATGTFPGVIRSELGLSAEPQCAVCHQGQTAVGTVTTPFGASLRARGLVFYSEPSLRTALSTLSTQNVDSDGDGMPDVEELKTGRDPNKNDATGGAPDTGLPPEPFYGCTAAPGAPVVLGLLALALRRRRK